MPDAPRDPDTTDDSEVTREPDPSKHPRRQIGPYRLLQRIGEGGMGEVWLAEQTTPVQRQVALKIIKAGMDSAQVVARFEAERQALALMDHPAIARVIDAGTTPQGRPYFAMEYVKGEPITAYCDRHRLTTPERLDLFIHVCEGVQHAHQKGIIHRDLKPSNVLVTIQDDHPVPKIIDFGVAKATAQHLTERTLFTELGVLIGTPEYMSPEQAEMGSLDIDTRTDVYALGVVLYELLTGALPFDREDLRRHGLMEIQRTIREKEPPRPSTRVTQLGPASTEAAHSRHTDPARLASELRGDLDWITMKALEKDRTRRYDTVMGLASDVRRHLQNEPVVASPPSTTYRVRKFARRHPGGVGVAAAAVVVLIAFATTMAVQAQRVARERDRASREAIRANQEAAAAKQVADFLVGLFQVSDPDEAKGTTITAREILDRGSEQITRELSGQPRVQRRLMLVMGMVYQNLGLHKKAGSLLEQALQVARRMPEDREADVAQLEGQLAWFYRNQGRLPEAITLSRHALALCRKEVGEAHPSTARSLRLLGILLRDKGEYREAQHLLEQSVALLEKTLGPSDTEVALSLYHLGWLFKLTGHPQEAKPVYERALGIFEATLGTDHTWFAWCLNDLSVVNENLRDYDASRRLQERATAIRARLLGPEHPDVAASLNNLGVLWWRMRDYRQAASACERALAIREKALGPEHPDVADTLGNLGLIYGDLGDPTRAKQCYARAMAIREKTYGTRHHRVADLLLNLGGFLEKQRESPAASATYERALAIYEESTGINSRDLADALFGVARLSDARGDRTRAASLLERLLLMSDEIAAQDKVFALEILEFHAALLRRVGRADKSAEIDARASVLRAQK